MFKNAILDYVYKSLYSQRTHVVYRIQWCLYIITSCWQFVMPWTDNG